MGSRNRNHARSVALVALPETGAAAFYVMYDVLTAVGTMWQRMTGEDTGVSPFEVQIVAPSTADFLCGSQAPIRPHAALADAAGADIVIVTDLIIDFDQDPRGRWPELRGFLRDAYANDAVICSICTGSIAIADSGLLDDKVATTHWSAADIFRQYFPRVRLAVERVLVPAGPDHRIVTCGGPSSWEDLSLYLIARFRGQAEAVRTAKIFLFGDRSEGQLPYAAMVRPRQHLDRIVADNQVWIAQNYDTANPVSKMVERSGLPDRTFKRRFRAATGYTPVAYVQALRIEEAKQMLESTAESTEEIARQVGYEDTAFFGRLFKRRTGMTPARYRQRYRGATTRLVS
jgi:transcriptional regulator GlxA family with amidase domain